MEWLHADNEGRTREVFESWMLEPEELARLRRDGSVRSAADILATRRHTRQAS